MNKVELITKFVRESNDLEGYFNLDRVNSYPDNASYHEKWYDTTDPLWTQHILAFGRMEEIHAMKRDLTVEDVMELHRVLCEGLLPNNGRAGGFRKGFATVGNQPTPQPQNIKWLLERVLDAPYGPMGYDPTSRHYAFEVVHPFADGNGRVGRLMEVFWWAQYYGGTIEDAATSCSRPLSHRDTYHRQIQDWRGGKAEEFFGKPLILL